MGEARADEVRARHEPHERAQTRRGQRTGEKEARHVGFEVATQYRGTTEDLEIGAQNGAM